MLSSFIKRRPTPTDMLSSSLFDEATFYKAFTRDLSRCRNEVIIESPFITGNRIASLLPIFIKMRSRGVKIVINTRNPIEYDPPFSLQAGVAIEKLQELGVQALFTVGHHRKLAIIDREVLWEGSLNILSQNDSCEIMRRIISAPLSEQMIKFVKLNKFLK